MQVPPQTHRTIHVCIQPEESFGYTVDPPSLHFCLRQTRLDGIFFDGRGCSQWLIIIDSIHNPRDTTGLELVA
ncbi:hypothetical protein BDQ94DRAFT_144759 [Aspergillus welwitschiae]|uniref:Uncharacterized protein n=1 Tax=Aspergillus welwitschiae TaxID=1341132 RepID=A0A3F3Q0G1_9EURO|nr:hypothetical protein BDQ94DRAFT_144759 [Aspergillus welwitschiae]RDH32648.1 hypothetical protein BDQ94DRAFT_144759 [Aspergillus welwitschiae]